MNEYITLYHNTTNDKAISISKQGIIAGLEVDKYGKGSEAEGSGVWCSSERGYGYGGATITFKIDVNDRDLWKANDTEYIVYRNIPLNEIVDIDLVVAYQIQCGTDRTDNMPTTMESDIPSAISNWGKDELLKVFKENPHLFVEPYNYKLLENLIDKGDKYCMGNIFNNKLTEGKKFIDSNDFNWNDNIDIDRRIYSDYLKQNANNSPFEDDEDYDTYYNSYDDEEDYYTSTNSIQDELYRFDKTVNDVKNSFVWACQETNQLDLISNTDGWRLRDFISEAEYQADKYVEYRVNYTEDEVPYHRAFAMWKRVVNYGNRCLLDDMLCVTEHMSKYDKLN